MISLDQLKEMETNWERLCETLNPQYTYNFVRLRACAKRMVCALKSVLAEKDVEIERLKCSLTGDLTTEDVEPDVLAVWTDFWRELVCPNGHLDVAQVARELHDWRVAMHEVSLVYDEITMGYVSKPNTTAQYVIDRVDELERERIQEARSELEDELKAAEAAIAKAEALLVFIGEHQTGYAYHDGTKLCTRLGSGEAAAAWVSDMKFRYATAQREADRDTR